MATERAGVGASGPAAPLATGDWTTAFELLTAEHGRRPLDPAELDTLARAAYGAGEFEAAITAWEELHARCRSSGDAAGAAAAATGSSLAAASLVCRLGRKRGAARALLWGACAAYGAAGYLGGHLVYGSRAAEDVDLADAHAEVD